MVLKIDNDISTNIEGFPLFEDEVPVATLAKFIHEKFCEATTILKESNTPKMILSLFMAEIDELLEVIEESPDDRVNTVAELGDLFHFWNDLFQLTSTSVANLLIYLDLDTLENPNLTIAQIKAIAAEKHADELVARDLLYELKAALWLLPESSEMSPELIGMVASHIFAVAVALNINVVYAVLMKSLRNRKKYDPPTMDKLHADGGNYDDIMGEMSAKWDNGMGGDEEFFAAFFSVAPIELSVPVVRQLATDQN